MFFHQTKTYSYKIHINEGVTQNYLPSFTNAQATCCKMLHKCTKWRTSGSACPAWTNYAVLYKPYWANTDMSWNLNRLLASPGPAAGTTAACWAAAYSSCSRAGDWWCRMMLVPKQWQSWHKSALFQECFKRSSLCGRRHQTFLGCIGSRLVQAWKLSGAIRRMPIPSSSKTR